MSKPTNLFRRGAVYWWRRRLTLSVFENFPISLSLSLLTRELSIARARGAAMTMVSERLRMTIQQRIIAGVLTPEQANSIANAEVKAFRSQLMMVDANLVTELCSLPVSPERSKWVLQQFWQGAQQGGLPDVIDQDYADHHWPDLTPDERQHLLELTRKARPSFRLMFDAVDRLHEAGAEGTELNITLVKRLIVRARAEVARQAAEGDLLGAWLHGESIDPAVPQRQILAPNYAEQLRAIVEVPTPLTSPSADPFGLVDDDARKILLMTPVELAEHHIEQKYAHLTHRKDGKRKRSSTGEQTLRQIRCAARMLQQSVPKGTPFSLITSEQVQAFDSYLDRLPTSYGKSPKHHSLDLVLADFCTQTDDRVEAGDLALDDVGLELPTTNKHFRYLQRMRRIVEDLCPNLPRVDYSKYTQPDLKGAREAREAYTLEQGEAIFALPPWTGCQSISERLEPGNSIIHDGLYWVLLLVWYTGARREEICAIKLEHIRQEHGVDYLDIVDGKTGNAIRRIAIASELKRLGFLTYVEALRSAGDVRLFPELQPGRTHGKLGDVFYKLWWIYLKPMVPGLVRGQAMHSCRHTVSTELKDLGVFPEFRNDLLGQAQSVGGEGVTRYSKATRLARLQEVVDQIPIVTAHLPDLAGFSPILPAHMRVPRPTRKKRHDMQISYGGRF